MWGGSLGLIFRDRAGVWAGQFSHQPAKFLRFLRLAAREIRFLVGVLLEIEQLEDFRSLGDGRRDDEFPVADSNGAAARCRPIE